MERSSRTVLETLIVDDEPIARARLRALCLGLPDLVRVVGEAADGRQALERIRTSPPELVLLDIAMPDLDGLGVAEALAKAPAAPAIVFCTAHPDHALDAFAVAAADYLLKPVSRIRLAQAIDRAARLRSDARASPSSNPWLDHIWVPQRDAMIRIDLDDVERIEADGDYVRLITVTGRFMLHLPLARLEARLDPDRFIRVRRSTIVRADRLRVANHLGGGAWNVKLSDGTSLRVGPTYWPALKARLLGAIGKAEER